MFVVALIWHCNMNFDIMLKRFWKDGLGVQRFESKAQGFKVSNKINETQTQKNNF